MRYINLYLTFAAIRSLSSVDFDSQNYYAASNLKRLICIIFVLNE